MTDSNLTIEQKVVQIRNDASPVLDHHLVVFERVGDGLRFRDELEPGKVFPRPFWSRREVVGYAVRCDPALRLSFGVSVRHAAEQINRCVVHIDLAYRVASPKLVAEKVANDPLGQLKEAVGRVVSRAVSRQKWKVILDDPYLMEEAALAAETVVDGESLSNLDYLGRVAAGLGFKLHTVELTRSLDDDDTKVAKFRKESSTTREINAIKAIEVEQTRDAALLTEHHQSLVGNIVRIRKLYDTVAEGGQQAVRQGVSGIHSFTALDEEMRHVLHTVTQLEEFVASSRQRMSQFDAAIRDQQAGGLGLSAGSAPTLSQGASFLVDVIRSIDALAADAAAKDRLLSVVLRLAAELLDGRDHDGADLELYAENVRDQVRALLPAISLEHREFFNVLHDPAAFGRRLGRS